MMSESVDEIIEVLNKKPGDSIVVGEGGSLQCTGDEADVKRIGVTSAPIAWVSNTKNSLIQLDEPQSQTNAGSSKYTTGQTLQMYS